jgi:phosphatidylinositol alpha-1,6-mannosyltransferase
MGTRGYALRPFFGIYKLLDRAMVRRADALLANSHFGAARLRAAYGREGAVITHGADFAPPSLAQCEEIKRRYGMSGKLVWLAVNFLHPRKRLDLYLRAFAEFNQACPESVALIVGAGPENDALRAFARESELEHAVRFTGFVPDDELPAYYGASDLYVHTGKNESFGLSVLEASAAGLPIIAVNEGGPREIVADGVTGMLVEPTPAALAAAARTLAQDAALRARMGAAGKTRVAACYSWERGAAEFLQAVSAVRVK